MRRTKSWRDDMDSKIHICLKDELNIVACLDNNQKGFQKKYQRNGKSVNYIKVTGCIIKKFYEYNIDTRQNQKQVKLTYVNQAIPSPYLMPHFEMLEHDTEGCISPKSLIDLLSQISNKTSNCENSFWSLDKDCDIVDYSGDRVLAFDSIVSTFHVLNMIRIVSGGIYNSTHQTKRFLNFTRDELKDDKYLSIYKATSALKGSNLCQKCNKFQYKCVEQWNPFCGNVSQFIIPRVSLHDKKSTDGYRKCIVELMTKHGILIKKSNSNTCYKWILGRNWDKKRIVLCLDGLSLDRH